MSNKHKPDNKVMAQHNMNEESNATKGKQSRPLKHSLYIDGDQLPQNK
jgi:hypothetical protein